jgi:hypothetical protein
MLLDHRLYVVVKEAVGHAFETYLDLAESIHDRQPMEFTYNRLDVTYVMQPQSIVPYVSLANLIGLLTKNDDKYVCILDQEPNPSGLQEIVTRKSVKVLENAGFTKEAYKIALDRLLQSANFVPPSPREVFQALNLDLTELQFVQLTNLSGIQKHFRFTLVTRRIMVPT